jgi:hypothetical protein
MLVRWQSHDPYGQPAQLSDLMSHHLPPSRNPPPTTEWSGRPAGWQPPPVPPPMRGGTMPHSDGIPILIIAGVLLIGVAISAKMSGGW